MQNGRQVIELDTWTLTLELPHLLEQNWLSRRFFTNQITVQWYTVLYYCTTRVTSFPSEQRGKEGGREPKKKEYIYSNHLPVTNFIYQCCKKMLFFRQISKLILTLRITQRFDKFFVCFSQLCKLAHSYIALLSNFILYISW